MRNGKGEGKVNFFGDKVSREQNELKGRGFLSVVANGVLAGEVACGHLGNCGV